jgi:hypothetical protein
MNSFWLKREVRAKVQICRLRIVQLFATERPEQKFSLSVSRMVCKDELKVPLGRQRLIHTDVNRCDQKTQLPCALVRLKVGPSIFDRRTVSPRAHTCSHQLRQYLLGRSPALNTRVQILLRAGKITGNRGLLAVRKQLLPRCALKHLNLIAHLGVLR